MSRISQKKKASHRENEISRRQAGNFNFTKIEIEGEKCYPQIDF
jgi:hypothetical protein